MNRDGIPQRQHPHLLFTAAEARTLRQRITLGPRSLQHLARATQWCDGFMDPGSPHFFDFRERQKDYWHCRQGNFVIPTRLMTLALTGWLAERDDFINVARDGLLTLINERVYEALGDYTSWREMAHDAGKYYKMLGLLYDLLFPFMDEEQRACVVAHADDTAAVSERFYERNLRDIGNNRGGRWLVGLGVMAMAFRDANCPRLNKPGFGQLAVRVLETSLRQTIAHDGAPYEGISYGSSQATFLVVAAEILKNCGLRNCTQDQRFHNHCVFLTHETFAHTGLPNTLNDCSPQLAPSIVYRDATVNRDPVSMWFWDHYVEDQSLPWSPFRVDAVPGDFRDVPWYLLWPDDDAPPARSPAAAGMSPKRRFTERGIVSIRSGWQPDDLHLTFFCGPSPDTGHRQADQAQVTLNFGGDSYLIDPGYTIWDDDMQAHRRASDAACHNTILIDGLGQEDKVEHRGWPMGRVTGFCANQNMAWTAGDFSEAYAEGGPLARAERQLQAVWQDGVPTHLVWVDELVADGEPHDYTLLLHTAASNRVEKLSDTAMVLHGNGSRLYLYVDTTSPAVEVAPFGGHQRLAIESHSVDARLVLIWAAAPVDEFAVAWMDEVVEVNLSLAGHRLRHTLPRGLSFRPDCGETPPHGTFVVL